MNVVGLAKCDSYSQGEVKSAVLKCLDNIGGLEKIIKRNSKVLLKPNLVMSFAKEKAATTHPEIVRAVGELLKDIGADIYLGDSPGLGSAKKVAASCGILEVAEELGIKIIEFTKGKNRQNPDNIKVGISDMAAEIEDMDFRINLPKFKTHMMTTLSLSVKNCFGLIVGPKKFQWHYRAGHDESFFSRMLLDVCDHFNPSLNIIDGVVGMEGNGPTSGTPVKTGFIAASENALALDSTCAKIAGLPVSDVGFLREAQKRDYKNKWQEPEIKGDALEEVMIKNLKLPETRPYNNMLPLFLRKIVRKVATSKPAPDPNKCTGCGVCKDICPADVITMADNIPHINSENCIRCYCCHELCPHSAMDISKNILIIIADILRRRK